MITLIKDDMQMPHYKRERVPETMSRYKLDVLAGADHPLQSEEFIYTLTPVEKLERDASEISMSVNPRIAHDHLSPDEVEFLNEVCFKIPKIDWAIENSFDGVYIKKYLQPSSYKMIYELYVYMEEKQATMWRLKYGSR